MAAPFISEYVNLFEFMNNYVFGSLTLTIIGFGMILFLLGVIFRMGIFTNFYIVMVYLFSMSLIIFNPLLAMIMFAVSTIWLLVELFT